jgi:ABC-type Zn uptake system ZnuABC Zn-binding protein ZnuA
MIRTRYLPLLTIVLLLGARVASADLQVVTTLAAYASIADEVCGGLCEVQSISRGDEDAHFVKPKPSFALMLRRADLFVTTGLDLELWAPVLIDKSGNRSIRVGAAGYISASQDIPLLDVPAVADRSGGDVHLYGNPHVFTSPLNAKIIGRNIANGLMRIAPGQASTFQSNLEAFEARIDVALYGQQLIEILGPQTLDPLARQGELIEFLQRHDYQGSPLIGLLGGWLARGLPFRGQQIVVYHKNWIYLTDLLGLQVMDYVEPKPGIPPSARHVHELIERIETQQIRVLLAASYFSDRQIASIAERAQVVPVRVPLGPGGSGPAGYLELVDLWVDSLADALAD